MTSLNVILVAPQCRFFCVSEVRIDPEQRYAKERYVSGIDDIKTGYSIKFSKSKPEELHKICIDESQHPTAYVIQKGHQKMGLHVSVMGLHVSVDSFHDSCNGSADELLRFGHIASAQEKQVFADEKAGKIQRQLPPATVYR